MLEIRFHGRGGQGTVRASEILATAFFFEERYVQAFPAFGVERRGAPVLAFVRVDEKPILLRNLIYTPDHVVVLDPSLLETQNPSDGLKSGGLILINTSRVPSSFSNFRGFRIASVDASAIAVRHGLGTPMSPIVNTAILGAYAGASKRIGIEAVKKAIASQISSKAQANVDAAQEAYSEVKVL